MGKTFNLRSDELEVLVRIPDDRLHNSRFDQSAFVEQIVLHGRHVFCEPEQKIGSRINTGGRGLCGEFVWNKLAEEALPGENFPKFGVGILKQRPDGGAFDIFYRYEGRSFTNLYDYQKDKALFIQQPEICLGTAAKITRELCVDGRKLILHSTVENTGNRPIRMEEYQHNFVSLDGYPVGPGYTLFLPFFHENGLIERLYPIEAKSVPSNVMFAENGCVHWNSSLDGCGFFLNIEGIPEIVPQEWSLWHEKTPAWMKERVSVKPKRAVVWGVEHCICTELFVPVVAEPGERCMWTRMWEFGDELPCF